jgi:hypothetical protein
VATRGQVPVNVFIGVRLGVAHVGKTCESSVSMASKPALS